MTSYDVIWRHETTILTIKLTLPDVIQTGSATRTSSLSIHYAIFGWCVLTRHNTSWHVMTRHNMSWHVIPLKLGTLCTDSLVSNFECCAQVEYKRNVTRGYDRKPRFEQWRRRFSRDSVKYRSACSYRRSSQSRTFREEQVLTLVSWIVTHLDMSTRFDTLTRHAKSPPSLLSSGFRSYPLVTFLIVLNVGTALKFWHSVTSSRY